MNIGAEPTMTLQLDIEITPVLDVQGVTVSFDGFKALNDLSMTIGNGELRCVIGPNGAGKTTLMDVITGKVKPDSGSVILAGKKDLTTMSEVQIAQTGVGRKFQKPTVFLQHSVFENLELAMRANKGVWSTLVARLGGEERDRIYEVAETIGLQENLDGPAGLLAHGQKQWLEIGMLLIQAPHVLLVDEPVAGMTHQESERTAELLVSLEGDHSIIVVEHDMGFVRSIARDVTVLHEGSVLAEGDMGTVQNDPRVIEVYLGS